MKHYIEKDRKHNYPDFLREHLLKLVLKNGNLLKQFSLKKK
jgi:hypothetical protein